MRPVIGIVGHEAAKFTPETEAEAKRIIRELVSRAQRIVSGHCHLGGVDIWAEELAVNKLIFPPQTHQWATGYKLRNLEIAKASDEVHVIVVKDLPPTYQGMRFDRCYHCQTQTHVKSGACWTAKQAEKMGKLAIWHEI